MNLVDELKAALPGWTVTGHDHFAEAVKPGTGVVVQCEPESDTIWFWARVDGMTAGSTYNKTVSAGVVALTKVIALGLARSIDAVARGQAALNALGGGK